MKPLGTITKDFPFIEEASRSEMESAMSEATDYWDFSIILGEKVCNNESSPTLVFFALLHARNLMHVKLIDKIEQVYPDVPLVKPFYIHLDESYVNIVDAIESSIITNPNPAVLFYLQYRLYGSTDQGSIEEETAQQKIEDLLERFKLPELYRAYYYRQFGHRLRAEGNPERAIKYFEKALELSRMADDQWHQIVVLRQMAQFHAQYSTDSDCFKRTRSYLREAREISEVLNDRGNIASILQFTTTTSFSRGTISECIDCELEAISIIESLGGEIGVYAYNLSNSYSTIGEGENALEWARCALDNWGSDAFRLSYSHMVMARAYIVLNRRVEAQQYLGSAKELILQSGLDYALAQWHQTNGRLERMLGDLDSAMDSFQRAFEINERSSRYARMRSCLYDLCLTELGLFSPSKESRNAEDSGPWMSRMKSMCAKNDLPGYQAWLMLLKAELRMKQGRQDTAFQILDAVIVMTDNAATRHQHEEAIKTRETWILEGIAVPGKKGTDTS